MKLTYQICAVLLAVLLLATGCQKRNFPVSEPEPQEPSSSQEERFQPSSEPLFGALDPGEESEAENEEESEPEEAEQSQEEQSFSEESSEAANASAGESAADNVDSTQIAATLDSGPSTLYKPSTSDIWMMYRQDPPNRTYTVAVDESQIIGVLREVVGPLEGKAADTLPEGAVLRGGILLLQRDYAKYSYNITDDGILVSEGGEETYHALSQENMAKLKAVFTSADSDITPSPQWLVWMNSSWVTTAKIEVDGKSYFATEPAEVLGICEEVRNLRVQPGSFESRQGSYEAGTGDTVITLTFNSGIAYRIIGSGNTLLVESSDMRYGCQYSFLSGGRARFDSLARVLGHMEAEQVENPVT